MQSVNKKLNFETRQKIAYLAALTLMFSYAELLIPRIFPYFRLGLGNAALLMGLELSFPAFMLLGVVKTVCANLMAGTLFSPFFLVSFAQSIASVLVMFCLSRMIRQRRILSLYGISVLGSAVSAVVQISLTSLYLGQGTWSLLGPMLIFNVISGVITAWLAVMLENAVGESVGANTVDGELKTSTVDSADSNNERKVFNIVLLIVLITASASVFFIKNTYVLCGFLLIAFVSQKLSGRRILLLPHISLWLFVLITSVLVPNGHVLFKVLGFSITHGALVSGIQKALRLSTVTAFSQCAVSIQPGEKSLLGMTLKYYKLMVVSFVNTPGSIFTKLRTALVFNKN